MSLRRADCCRDAAAPGWAGGAEDNWFVNNIYPLLVISDKHLESTRERQKTNPQTLSLLLSSRIEHAPLLFHSDLKAAGTSTHAEQLKPQTAAMEGEEITQESCKNWIGISKTGDKHLVNGCASPGCSPEAVRPSPGRGCTGGARQCQHHCAGNVCVNGGKITPWQPLLAGIPPEGQAEASAFWGAGLSEVGFCLLHLVPSSRGSERDYPKLFIYLGAQLKKQHMSWELCLPVNSVFPRILCPFPCLTCLGFVSSE